MKSLIGFAGTEDPVLSKPFTVLDPKGTVWTVATDRVWFVAVQGRDSAPRFKGPITSLTTVLNLLRIQPFQPVDIEVEEVLARLQPEGIGQVLDVAVSLHRLYDLLKSCPTKQLLAWNCTDVFNGEPGLGFSSSGWRAYLMGFDDVKDAPVFDLLSPERSLFEFAMSQG